MESKDVKDVLQLACTFAYMLIMFWIITQSNKSRKAEPNIPTAKSTSANIKSTWDKITILSKIIGAVAALLYAVYLIIKLLK